MARPSPVRSGVRSRRGQHWEPGKCVWGPARCAAGHARQAHAGLLTSQHSVLRCPLSRNVKLPVFLTWFSLPPGFLMGTPVSPQVAVPGAGPQLAHAGPTPRQGGQNAMRGRQPRARHGWRHTRLAQATAGQASWPGRPQGSGGWPGPGPPAAPHQARRPCQPSGPERHLPR